MIIIPEQEDASPGANGWSVREGSESKASDIRRSLLVNVVEFGLLDTSNVTKGIREESVNCIFTALIIKSTGVPIRNGQIWSNHLVQKRD
jgi:hypothetical protein